MSNDILISGKHLYLGALALLRLPVALRSHPCFGGCGNGL